MATIRKIINIGNMILLSFCALQFSTSVFRLWVGWLDRAKNSDIISRANQLPEIKRLKPNQLRTAQPGLVVIESSKVLNSHDENSTLEFGPVSTETPVSNRKTTTRHPRIVTPASSVPVSSGVRPACPD
jgi:hypothetical protein